jgi:HSP20 family protein
MPAEHELLKKFLGIQERIHTVFEDSLASMQGGLPVDPGSTWAPAVDVYETAQEWVLTAETPGVEQEQIDVRILDHVLYLRGERAADTDSKQTYHRMERPTGRFERKFELPDAVDREGVTAKIENGVLTVVLPKIPNRRRSVRISVDK